MATGGVEMTGKDMLAIIAALAKRDGTDERDVRQSPTPLTRAEIACLFAKELGY